MKTALLPIALLTLSLPGAAFAYPATIVYRVNTSQPAVPVYQAPAYGPATYYRPINTVPSYGLMPPASAPVNAVVRYRVPASTAYAAPSAYGYGYGTPTPYGVAAVPRATGQRCAVSPGRVLVGAALGGLTSAVLAPKQRSWAVPVGAAIGGLGGLATGC